MALSLPIYTKTALIGEDIEIGDYTYGVPVVLYRGSARLSIGKFCSIAERVTILLGGEHHAEWVTTYPFPELWEEANIPGYPLTKGDVRIGNDVWIGHEVLILSGVSIGDDAVLGARCVVASNVPPYSVMIGNPAKELRKRFDDKTIDNLLAIKWWDWDIETIKAQLPFLCAVP